MWQAEAGRLIVVECGSLRTVVRTIGLCKAGNGRHSVSYAGHLGKDISPGQRPYLAPRGDRCHLPSFTQIGATDQKVEIPNADGVSRPYLRAHLNRVGVTR